VVAPPYDVIDPELEQKLLARDPHNIVRLTFGKTPSEGRTNGEYRRAAETLARWRRDGILLQDSAPSIYVVEQSFTLGGRAFTQHGFIAGVLLEAFGAGTIFPHERTAPAPRSDRFRLLAACRTNLSQVLGIYSDPDGAIDQFVRGLCVGDPIYCFRDTDDVGHMVWALRGDAPVSELAARIRPQTLVIADGHHRYESAYEYCRQHRSPDLPSGSAPVDYIPAFCVSVANPGLKTLATHRRVRTRGRLRQDALLKTLAGHFELEHTAVGNADSLQRDFDLASRGAACVGCYLPGAGLYILHPRDLTSLRPRFPSTADSWWTLPVSLLHHVVLPDALQIPPGSPEESALVEYRHDATQIYWGVESGQFTVGFLLPPTSPQEVVRVAALGQRLPPKSTYFHPKLPSGLALHMHEDNTGGQRLGQ
jgi:uncharacterized protein (DUF1015 family)